jgi:nucleotide-binding universal stress UspA family protein
MEWLDPRKARIGKLESAFAVEGAQSCSGRRYSMRVLAGCDNSADAQPVAEFASALAKVLDSRVDGLHVRTDGEESARQAAAQAGIPLRVETDDPAECLRREAEHEDVAAVVLGCHPGLHRDSPVGAVAWRLLTTLSKPVAIVPCDAPHPARLGRVLVPLEGTRSSSLAPRRTIEFARDAGLEIVLVHVFRPDSVPMFTDQPQHETANWAHEFLRRYSPCPPEDVRLETRVGEPREHVVDVAREIDADVIALGWAQELSAGRAPVVRAALEQAHLPVFLIPVATNETSAPRSG